MRAGRLNRRITIQRKTVTQSASGEQIVAWSTIAARRAASMLPVRGDERFTAPQLGASEQIEFRIRYSADVSGLSPQDRIIHPALDDGSPPSEATDRQIHDIVAVHELGRREGLQIITVRRTDTAS
jgi:SPP1 family predicted phage head-tail adaptor